jgi:hypothetical protein
MNQCIQKIKVKSKIKDRELLNGYLYITDNDWALVYAELSSHSQSMIQTFSIVYNDFGNDIHLPVSYLTNIYFNLLVTSGKYHITLHWNIRKFRQIKTE